MHRPIGYFPLEGALLYFSKESVGEDALSRLSDVANVKSLLKSFLPDKFVRFPVQLLMHLEPSAAVLIHTVAMSMNRVEGSTPLPFISKRLDPTLAYDEQITLMMSENLPVPFSQEAGYPITIDNFAVYVRQFAADMLKCLKRRVSAQRDHYSYACHLLHLVEETGSTRILSQKELSFLILCFHGFYSRTFVGSEAGEYVMLPRPARNPLSVEPMKYLFANVLDTSKNKMLTRISNRDRATLTMSKTPYLPTLKSFIGDVDNEGNFDDIEMKEGPALHWELTEQLSAVSEEDKELVFLPQRDDKLNNQACITFNFFNGPNQKSACREVWDDMNIDFSYDRENGSMLMSFESIYRNRRISRTSDPTEYYLSQAMEPDQIVSIPVVKEGIDNFPLCKFLPRHDIFNIGDSAKLDETNSLPILYFAIEADVGQRKLSKMLIPLHRLLGFGRQFIKPLLRNYVRLTTAQLYFEAPMVVEYCYPYLGLTRQLERKNKLPITISWNAFIRKTILDQPVDDNALQEYILHLTSPLKRA
jgi:hypothetical protein